MEGFIQKHGINLISLKDAGIDADIVEDGETFEENALIKVRAIKPYVKDINHTILLADDSGLCVDALDGEPGIFSARYAGLNVTYLDNNKKLLNFKITISCKFYIKVKFQS